MKLWLLVKGRVQGVFYRAFVCSVARQLGSIVGFVRNLGDGSVEIYAEGEKEKLDAFIKAIDAKSDTGACVKELIIRKENEEGFVKPAKKYLSFVVEY